MTSDGSMGTVSRTASEFNVCQHNIYIYTWPDFMTRISPFFSPVKEPLFFSRKETRTSWHVHFCRSMIFEDNDLFQCVKFLRRYQRASERFDFSS